MNLNDNRNNNNQDNNDNKKKFPNMKKSHTITFWLVMLLLVFAIYSIQFSAKGKIKEISYTTMLEKVENGEILRAVFSEKDVSLWGHDNIQYHCYLPFEDPDLPKEFQKKKIDVSSKKSSRWFEMLISWLPFIIIIGFWIFMMRQMQGGGSKAFSFGKSKAKLFLGGKTNTTFKDVAGVEEAKEELEEIVDFLKAPEKFQRLGGRIPRGVLLLGRPGTGKTLLAKAVAGEAGVPFYSISGSDFVEMFVGVGASRVRDLFQQAKRSAPCIAFIDEIDAVGRHRGTGVGGGHDEREQTLNQLLVEMDGFEANDYVIIVAATNRPDVLDPALLRPGRFDRQVIVDLPDIKGREAILAVHCKKLPISKDVKFGIIARSTPGFSGADLANLANEAALMAARKNKTKIEMSDFEEAKDKVTMGKERKSRVISEEEKKNTAYHENGHVLCSIFMEKTEPIHKVTIIPRGFSAGATHYLQTDKSNYSRSYLEQRLVVLIGGRAAEEVVFGELTTGAGNDIERASDLAKKMVCDWGMSKKLGPMKVGKYSNNMFLGKQMQQVDIHSEETARMVDSEIRAIIHTAHEKAIEIIENHRDLLDIISKELLEKETLDVDEIYGIVLDNVDESEKEIVERKFKKAAELKIDSEKNPKQDDEKVQKSEPKNDEISEKEKDIEE